MRYNGKFTLINSNYLYNKKFIDKGINFIEYHQVPDMKYPSANQISNLEISKHVWRSGDRLYKLSHKFYGDSQFWWVIAFYNQRPTESYYANGTEVLIPQPLDRILGYLGY